MDSLWGEEFTVKEDDVKSILDKVKNKKVVAERSTTQKLKSKNVPVEDKIRMITEDVNKILGHYKEDTICIRTYEDLVKYFDKAIDNGIIAVDTETGDDNGYGTLDTIEGHLMGLCIYTPGMKNAYVPVYHYTYVEDFNGQIQLVKLLDNQLTNEQIGEQLQRLLDNQTKCIFHNATFDIEVLKSNCGVKLQTYWDTQTGAVLLDENELKGLKMQYKLHINPDQDKYNIEHLFQGLPYSIFDPDLFALYAATDSYMTYQLYEYQLEQFERPENKEIYDLLKDIEIPILNVIVDMEMTGIEVDIDYASRMSSVYHKKADEVQARVDEELLRLKPTIDAWKATSEANAPKRVYPAKKSKMSDKDIAEKFTLIDEKGKHYKLGKSAIEQLNDPIDLASPTQLRVLLYDILKVPVVDPKDPTGTGAEILKSLSEEKHIKICELILEKRAVEILISNFIDKMPEYVKKSTGRLHCRFNSTGTQTGRFSSSDPSLQQIPSHDKAIRMMFKASDGMSIVGADYSAQEPRSTASLSQDKSMLAAYDEGKDLYAVIGAACFKNNYEDNLEFHPVTHVLQPDGKKRRSKAKTILLGITYGMSAHTLAERMELSDKEGEEIIDNFYKGFPGVKKLTDDSQQMLREKGYITDMWGRRRHIPDGQLPEFSITPMNATGGYEFNPLIGAVQHEDKLMQAKIKDYQDKLAKAKWKKDVDLIVAKAKYDGLSVKNNRGFINRALRQCLNARIQGTAASMTKRAMVLIHDDEELNRLGFRLLITVHDEVLGECPTENSEAAAKRLSEVMVAAAKEKCICKFKCDGYNIKRWYADECAGEVHNDYVKAINKGKSEDEAFAIVKSKYEMIQEKYLREMVADTFDPNMYTDI